MSCVSSQSWMKRAGIAGIWKEERWNWWNHAFFATPQPLLLNAPMTPTGIIVSSQSSGQPRWREPVMRGWRKLQDRFKKANWTNPSIPTNQNCFHDMWNEHQSIVCICSILSTTVCTPAHVRYGNRSRSFFQCKILSTSLNMMKWFLPTVESGLMRGMGNGSKWRLKAPWVQFHGCFDSDVFIFDTKKFL